MLDFATTHGCRSHNESAVGNGVGDARKLLGAGYHPGSSHRGSRFPKCNIIRIHDSQACEPKIAHRSSRRADIQRIAWAYQHDAQTRMDVFGPGPDSSQAISQGGLLAVKECYREFTPTVTGHNLFFVGIP